MKNLQALINFYSQGPGLLKTTQLDVLRNHVESIFHTHTTTSGRKIIEEEENSEVISNDEDELETDENAEILESDEDIPQEMGDENMKPKCEIMDLADKKRE